MQPNPQELLRMSPQTKPEFEISISSVACEDYILLFGGVISSWLIWFSFAGGGGVGFFNPFSPKKLRSACCCVLNSNSLSVIFPLLCLEEQCRSTVSRRQGKNCMDLQVFCWSCLKESCSSAGKLSARGAESGGFWNGQRRFLGGIKQGKNYFQFLSMTFHSTWLRKIFL